uniref:Uncharacterized protein n=1 Tax=Alexandrium monilatum TaxID=311494 RepID=A0A6T1L9C1_9DINO
MASDRFAARVRPLECETSDLSPEPREPGTPEKLSRPQKRRRRLQLLAAAKASQHGPHQFETFGQSVITTGELNDKLDQILQLLRPSVVASNSGAMDPSIWTTSENPLDQDPFIWNKDAIPFEPGLPCPPFPPGQGDPGVLPNPTLERIRKGKVGFKLEANTYHTWDPEAQDFKGHTSGPETVPEARDTADISGSGTGLEARDTIDLTTETEGKGEGKGKGESAESAETGESRDIQNEDGELAEQDEGDMMMAQLERLRDRGGEYCRNCDRWAPRCQCGASENQFGNILDEGLFLCSECLSSVDGDLIQPCNGTSRVHERPRNFHGEAGMFHQDCMEAAKHLPGCEFKDDPLFLCRVCVETATPADCEGCMKITAAKSRPRPKKRKPK